MKQKILEEAAERLYPVNATGGAMEMLSRHQLNNSIKQEGFLAGAKWQAELIPLIIEEYLETAFISKEKGYMNPKQWFEQFKNK
jgi:hypothetical protein